MLVGRLLSAYDEVNESADGVEDQAEDAVLEAGESDDHIIDAVFAPWDEQEQTEEGMEDEAEEEYQDFSMGM